MLRLWDKRLGNSAKTKRENKIGINMETAECSPIPSPVSSIDDQARPLAHLFFFPRSNTTGRPSYHLLSFCSSSPRFMTASDETDGPRGNSPEIDTFLPSRSSSTAATSIGGSPCSSTPLLDRILPIPDYTRIIIGDASSCDSSTNNGPKETPAFAPPSHLPTTRLDVPSVSVRTCSFLFLDHQMMKA